MARIPCPSHTWSCNLLSMVHGVVVLGVAWVATSRADMNRCGCHDSGTRADATTSAGQPHEHRCGTSCSSAVVRKSYKSTNTSILHSQAVHTHWFCHVRHPFRGRPYPGTYCRRRKYARHINANSHRNARNNGRPPIMAASTRLTCQNFVMGTFLT